MCNNESGEDDSSYNGPFTEDPCLTLSLHSMHENPRESGEAMGAEDGKVLDLSQENPDSAYLSASASIQPEWALGLYQSEQPAFNDASAYWPVEQFLETGPPNHDQYLRYCFYVSNSGNGYCTMERQDWGGQIWVAHISDHLRQLFQKENLFCHYCKESFSTTSGERYDKKVEKLANHIYNHIQDNITFESPESVSQTPSNASSSRYYGAGAQHQGASYPDDPPDFDRLLQSSQ